MSDIKGLGMLGWGIYLGRISAEMENCRKLYEKTGFREYKNSHNAFRRRLLNLNPTLKDVPPILRKKYEKRNVSNNDEL